MKKLYFLLFTILISGLSFGQEAIITGYVDSPCPSQLGRTVEIYVDGTIDFTGWNLVRQSNGGGYSTNLSLSGLGTISNSFAYITNDATTLNNEFGISTNVIVNSGINDNGNDAFQIINDVATVIDRFGEDGVDGSGTDWDHLDSYYYRVNGTSANSGTFNVLDFTFGAINLLDNKGLCNSSSALSTFVPFGTYSTTASSTPTINGSGSVSGLFYYEGNPPSSEETFTISGINLTADIVVTAPTNFEVSLTSGSGFTSSVNVSPTTGTVDPTDIYVRLASGLSANSYSGDVTLSSIGATDQIIALSGLVSPADPLISISGSVSSLEYVFGSGPSNEDSFSIEGIFLTEDITVTAPTNFEVSLTSGSGYSSSVIVTQSGGTATSTDIYVRLASGLSEGSYSGNITATSTGASNKNVAASGAVYPVPTCSNVGDIIITEVMQNPSKVDDADGEYFEVYNTTSSSINMKGWSIVDLSNDAENFTIITDLIVPANGYAVLGVNGDTGTNGGITVDYVYDGSSTFLGNSDDEISIQCSSTVIDEISWDGGTNWPDPTGASMELSITAMNSTDNDDGVNWGEATTSFGSGDLGTPGTANDFTLDSKSFEINGFAMYPNPTSLGYVTLASKNNAKMSVAVFDLLGKQVLNKTVSNNKLDVSSLTSGVYLMKVEQGNAVSTTKVVIQ